MGEFLRADEVYGRLSPMGRRAVDYVRSGLAVIPLRPGDKVPVTDNGVNNWTTDPDAVADYWHRNPSANVGIVCGQPSHNLVVIDVDRHGGVDGMGSIGEWATSNGLELPETVTFETGSGGRHYLYRTAQEVRGSVNRELAVDVKGKGGYIVAPPSLHPNGEYYEELVGLDDVPIADADAAVYSLIESVRPSQSMGEGERRHFELPETIPNGQRNDTLYRYACSLRARRMDQVEVLALLREQNGRCVEPLPDSDLAKIADSACTKPAGPSAEVLEFKKRAGGSAEEATYEVPDEPPGDKPDPSTTNGVLEALNSDEDVCRGLAYNMDESMPYVTEEFIPGVFFDSPHPFTDEEEAALFARFERTGRARELRKFQTALKAYFAEDRHRYSPIRDMVEALPLVRCKGGGRVTPDSTDLEYSDDGGKTWEPVPLDAMRGMLLPTYLDAEVSAYNRAVEVLLSRALVARSLHPGCQFDYMVILMGDQGIAKSSFIRRLAIDETFAMEGLKRFDEEGLKQIEGKVVAEVSEMANFRSDTMDNIKAFITTRKDTYRKSYARYATTVPRRTVLIGTTNDELVLDDPTGNRRFLIVECRRRKADEGHPGIFTERMTDVVRIWWAQAMQEYRDMGWDEFGGLLVLPKEVHEAAEQMADKHSFEDTVLASVSDYLDGLPPDIRRVNVRMVMTEAMGYDTKEYNDALKWKRSDVARAIGKCGWVKEPGKQKTLGEGGKSYGTAMAWARP